MPKHRDITNQEFGRLTALRHIGRDKTGAALWTCRCRCGVEKPVRMKEIVGGSTVSCGCHRRERLTVHGNRSFPEYGIWKGIKVRCYNKNNKAYKNYGGRGITVCDRWREKNGFTNFLSDMGRRPSPKHTIDRKENNGPYSPDNCRWATQKQQCRNFRRNRIVTLNGISRCVKEWSEIIGVLSQTIISRLERGCSPEEALSRGKLS